MDPEGLCKQVERNRCCRTELQPKLNAIINAFATLSSMAGGAEGMPQLESHARALVELFSTTFKAVAALGSEVEDVRSRINTLEAELEQRQFLAQFLDPISFFREIIAEDMGYSCWGSLGGKLRMERYRKHRPVLASLEKSLHNKGLQIDTWNHLDTVYAADVSGLDMDPLQALHLIRSCKTPEGLQQTASCLEEVFTWLSTRLGAVDESGQLQQQQD